MRLTLLDSVSGRVAAVDLDASDSSATLAAIAEAELGVPTEQQVWMLPRGPTVPSPSTTLRELGLVDQDMVTVQRVNRRAGSGPTSSGGGGGGATAGAAAPGGFRLVGLPRRRGSAAGGSGGGGGAPAPKRVAIDPEMYLSLTWDDLPAGVTADQLHTILQVREGRGEGGIMVCDIECASPGRCR